MKISELEIGMSKSVQKVITREDTALNFGSGALNNLLATPTLAALMIEAAVKLIDPLLPEGYITIGKMIEIEHEHPTKEGMTVTVTAKLVEVNDSRLSLEIIAYDELGRIGSGYHERRIVKQEILLNKVEERFSILQSRP
ncbi:MAG: thioesterase family protein [Clostridia bacterium]